MKKTNELALKEPTVSGFDKISQLFEQSNIATSYNKLICLTDGRPVDYIILNVNPAFEKMTGLEKSAISGKRFSEVTPQESGDLLADRIDIFANVALTGIPVETERLIEHFQKWFHINVYSPKKGYFIELLQDITERKQCEASLGLSKSIKKFATSANGLWILNAEGITTYVNNKISSMLGYSVNELMGKEFLHFLDEHSRVIAREAGLPFRTFKDRRLELEFLHNAGNPVYALVAAEEPIEPNEFGGLVLNIYDISEQKRIEQALSKSQKKYSGLFQHLTEGFAYCQVLFDKDENATDFVFSDVNDTFRRLTRINDKPILGKKAGELFPALNQLLPDWRKIYSKTCAKQNKSMTIEKYVVTSDRWFLIQAYCPEPGYLAAIIHDITQPKKAEAALKQSEKQYKKLANSITDLFFAVNSSLKFTYWNSASEQYTGISVDNAVGRHVFDVFGKDKTAKHIVRVFLSAMRTHKPQTFTDKLTKGDDNCQFEMRVYPTGNGVSVFARDITERLKMQHTLEQYAVHLEELVKSRTERLKGIERLAAIGETAGMIGHDIRNPLQSIIGEVYLVKEELKILPESEIKNSVAESINAIEEQTAYINKIVTDLQDYAKPLEPLFQEVNLEDVIQDVLSMLEIPTSVNFTYFLENPLPNLKTDLSFMKRILTNLALNGLQAMPDGGNLSISVFPRTKTVIIAVSDTGVGIPETVKDKIFKPLFTTKSKGQGFGLAVVKKLVEALNGNISFETKPEKGTTFILEVPIWPN